MDEIIQRIKDYVLVIDASLADDDYLDYVIGDVVDRALIYTNRIQLVDAYEEDNEEEAPIPSQLERPLAGVVGGVYKTVQEQVSATTGAISSLTDNGQSVTYLNELANYVSSKSDAEIFSGVRELLNNFRIPTIVENP